NMSNLQGARLSQSQYRHRKSHPHTLDTFVVLAMMKLNALSQEGASASPCELEGQLQCGFKALAQAPIVEREEEGTAQAAHTRNMRDEFIELSRKGITFYPRHMSVFGFPIASPEQVSLRLRKPILVIDAIIGVLIICVLLREALEERLLRGGADVVDDILILELHRPEVDTMPEAHGGPTETIIVVPRPAKGAKPVNVY